MNDELLGKKKAAMRIRHSVARSFHPAPGPVCAAGANKQTFSPQKDEPLLPSPLKTAYDCHSIGLLTDLHVRLRPILVT